MQYHNYPGKHLGGEQPRHYREAQDLPDKNGYGAQFRGTAVLARMEVLAYGESHDEEGYQLSDYHRGEDLDTHGLLEPPLVDQSLRRYSQARKRQNSSQSHGLGEAQAQSQIEQQVRSNRQ